MIVIKLCVFISSPVREGSTFLVITGLQFFRTELKSVGKVSADANLKRFQHKVLKASGKPTLNMGEFRVAERGLKIPNRGLMGHSWWQMMCSVIVLSVQSFQ